MAPIQITDRNFSDWEFMEELTDEELLAINGGGSRDNIKDKRKGFIMWLAHFPVWSVTPIRSIWPR
jgi:hypothetical protein